MESNNILRATVGVVLAVVVLSVIAIPMLSNSAVNAADLKNYNNESSLMSLTDSGETITIEYSSGTLKINDVTYTPTSNSTVLITDTMGLDVFQYNGNWLYRYWFSGCIGLTYPSAIDLTASNGQITGSYVINNVETAVNAPYTYALVADEDGEYVQVNGQQTEFYINSDKQIILNGCYYTGDKDTFYEYYNGEMYTTTYTSSIAITKELVDDTYDVYNVTNVSVTVDDEEFTPFRAYIPATITGHVKTTESDLIELIPLLLAVSLVLGVIAYAIRARLN